MEGRATGAWLIDTHRGLGWRSRLAGAFDVAFVAQRRAAKQVTRASGTPTTWLPLAVDRASCDPGPDLVDRRWDVAFVGAAPPGSFRHQLLTALGAQVDLAPWGTYIAPDQMMDRYRHARVVVNVPVADDLNMRAFEAAGARARLVTGPMDGLDQILSIDAVEISTGRHLGEWIEAITRCLRDPDSQPKADLAHREVLGRHTYHHRVDAILDRLTDASPRVTTSARADGYAAAYARWGDVRTVARLPQRPTARLRGVAAATTLRALSTVKRRVPSGWPGTTRF
jgi:hypothetical protein